MPDGHISRRAVLGSAAASTALLAGRPARAEGGSGHAYEVTRTEAEWRAMLSEEEFRILREGGTETRFASPLVEETRPGVYHCRGCDLPAYDGEWKTVLDKGWVFFYHAVPDAALMSIDGVPSRYQEMVDLAALSAIEVHCRRCGSHFGHILIVDGELLHCVNGTSFAFRPEAA